MESIIKNQSRSWIAAVCALHLGYLQKEAARKFGLSEAAVSRSVRINGPTLSDLTFDEATTILNVWLQHNVH